MKKVLDMEDNMIYYKQKHRYVNINQRYYNTYQKVSLVSRGGDIIIDRIRACFVRESYEIHPIRC